MLAGVAGPEGTYAVMLNVVVASIEISQPSLRSYIFRSNLVTHRSTPISCTFTTELVRPFQIHRTP